MRKLLLPLITLLSGVGMLVIGSGLGGDDGKHGMLEFTQTRLVVMSY